MGGKAKLIVRDIWDNIRWPTVLFLEFQRKRRENRMEDIFEEKMDKNIPKLMQDSISSVNFKQNKCKENHKLGISYLNC